jgi:PAS domain S-box-containing protein
MVRATVETNVSEKRLADAVNRLLVLLKRNKPMLVRRWAAETGMVKPGYVNLNNEDIEVGASSAFDAFCDIIEKDDYENMDKFIRWVTEKRRSQNISFTEIQRGFSNFRYILAPIILKMYKGDELRKVLDFVERMIDSVIFRFSDFFKSIHEQALENYANDLDKEVKTRTNELEESRKNYQILIEGISNGCFVCQEGKMVFANKAFCEMHGYSFNELIGKEYLKLVAPDLRTIVGQHFRTQFDGRTETVQYVYLRQNKQGHYYPTENRVTLIKYRNEDAFLGWCTDITQRLEAEENLRQKERLALIGKLTTSIAHEVRNPLSAMKMNVQVLLNHVKLEDYDLRRMQIVDEQLAKLESVIAQMLDFAKPVRLEYTLTNIPDLLQRGIELVEPAINERGCRVSVKLGSNLPSVFVDKEKMGQALTNILKNAAEASGRHNRVNKIEVKAARAIHDLRDYIKISITDKGVGIAAEDQKYIFEPFYTKGKKDGVGLGLPNVKKILDAHSGHVSVKSSEGKGTCFEILIPTELSMSGASTGLPFLQ